METPPPEQDWTEFEGFLNNSAEFQLLTRAVDQMIRSQAHSLLNGRSKEVAHFIVGQLAHKYRMVPTLTAAEMMEAEQ